MTTAEFSNEFDILYNNIVSNQSPGVDQYEKSVFLTRAQEEIIKNYFNPKGNKYQEGFGNSPKREIDFSNIIKNKTISINNQLFPPEQIYPPVENNDETDNEGVIKRFDIRSKLFSKPNDIMFILNEFCVVNITNRGTSIQMMIPLININNEEYYRLMSKPFKSPIKYHGWKLTQNKDYVEIVLPSDIQCSDSQVTYRVKYVKRPDPIILEDLRDLALSINGKDEITECELDPELHNEILRRAVELAKSAYLGDLNTTIQMGQRSE